MRAKRREMTLGQELLAELARRHEIGIYFDFPGHRKLRQVASIEDLQLFLHNQGCRT